MFCFSSLCTHNIVALNITKLAHCHMVNLLPLHPSTYHNCLHFRKDLDFWPFRLLLLKILTIFLTMSSTSFLPFNSTRLYTTCQAHDLKTTRITCDTKLYARKLKARSTTPIALIHKQAKLQGALYVQIA